ncbi:hypothetical protein GCM10023320_12460 [Pseudonocardia adelaidensis]|uniref:FAS1 domain-containing protein n=1 Tax=Pseudonocardia adelaidensis TaxID=648754 RepID=A0ABP9NCR7_9PSEU
MIPFLEGWIGLGWGDQWRAQIYAGNLHRPMGVGSGPRRGPDSLPSPTTSSDEYDVSSHASGTGRASSGPRLRIGAARRRAGHLSPGVRSHDGVLHTIDAS